MSGLVSLIAAAALTVRGLSRINTVENDGPPDLYLQDDIHDITGQHLCDRRLAGQLRRSFDRRYGRRLDDLHQRMITIFGADAMRRDIVRVSSCRAFSVNTAAARRRRLKGFRRRREGFAAELLLWEHYMATNQRG